MESKPVLFIDLLNLYCRSFASVPLTNDNGEHVGGVYGSLNALQSYIKRFEPSECIIAWEGVCTSVGRSTTRGWAHPLVLRRLVLD